MSGLLHAVMRRFDARARDRRAARTHAERMADEGAQVRALGDPAVFRTKRPDERETDLLLQAVAVFEREPLGRDRLEYLDHHPAAEDGEISVRRHHLRRVV